MTGYEILGFHHVLSQPQRLLLRGEYIFSDHSRHRDTGHPVIQDLKHRRLGQWIARLKHEGHGAESFSGSNFLCEARSNASASGPCGTNALCKLIPQAQSLAVLPRRPRKSDHELAHDIHMVPGWTK